MIVPRCFNAGTLPIGLTRQVIRLEIVAQR
jgi:hypothetical protein